MAKASQSKQLTTKDVKDGMIAIRDAAVKVQGELDQAEGFDRTIAMASGLQAIREAVTDGAMAAIMSLTNTDIGFKTDKDYSTDVVRDSAIRALMHGAYLHGNEFNIIAGQCYLTQAFFLRKLREYPGVTDLVIEVDSPSDGMAVGKQTHLRVGGYAACRVNGVLVEVECRSHSGKPDRRLTVTAHSGDVDQATGKAKKRLAQRLFERIAGVVITEGASSADVNVIEPNVTGHQDAAGEDSQTGGMDEAGEHSQDQSDPNDWRAEVAKHNVPDQANLIRNAPSKEDRDSVIAAAREQHKAGTLTAEALDLLERYAAFKNAEQSE